MQEIKEEDDKINWVYHTNSELLLLQLIIFIHNIYIYIMEMKK